MVEESVQYDNVADAVAERLRQAVDDHGLVGLVALAHDRSSRGLLVYWTGAVPRAVLSVANEAEIAVEIAMVPFDSERVMATVRYIVDAARQSRISIKTVGPRMDWTGVQVRVDRDAIALGEASLAEIMSTAPAEIAEVPVTVVGSKISFVAL